MDWKQTDHYLIGEAWTSTEAYVNIEKLCDLGSRFAGSPSGRAARDFILDKFKAYGVGSPHTDPFDLLIWTRGSCHLRTLFPIERTLRSAISLVYSPNADQLRGQVIDCGVGSEKDFAREENATSLHGNIAMVTTANPENGPAIHRREKYGRAVAAGARGFIYVNHTPGLLAETGSLRPGKIAEIPAVGLAYEEGWELSHWCKRGKVEIEIGIRNETMPGQGYHVIGEVKGKTDETIVVGAHYDGHDISQGAMDDGTGTILILELARLLAPMQYQFKRTVRLIAFDAEELGVLGSQEYVNNHRGEFGNVALMINLDGAAGPVATHGFLTSGFQDTEAVIKSYAKDFGYPLSLKDRIVTASDNFPFFMEGIPAICMSARSEKPGMGRGFGHTAADTLDKVVEVDLKASVMTIARMLARLANHDRSLGARKNRDELKKILIEKELEKPLRAQDKWPF